MIAVNLVGFKKSGKTTLALALGEELRRRGVKAAAAKFSHQPALDKGHRDSDRLAEVYAQCVALAAAESAGLWKEKRHLADLLPLLSCEALVVEGGKSLGWMPRILLPRAPEDVLGLTPELALATWSPEPVHGLPCVQDIAALADLVLARGFALPGLDCGGCGRADCRGLAQDIVAGRAEPGQCQARGGDIEVMVNGQPVGLGPFVSKVVSGAILGMLRELKGFAPGPVDIRIR
jgi:molybdopterin-guanine dinucleotide biosynthesis adapter protein